MEESGLSSTFDQEKQRSLKLYVVNDIFLHPECTVQSVQFAQMTFLTVVKIKQLLIWACVSTYRSRIQGITAVVNLPALLKL